MVRPYIHSHPDDAVPQTEVQTYPQPHMRPKRLPKLVIAADNSDGFGVKQTPSKKTLFTGKVISQSPKDLRAKRNFWHNLQHPPSSTRGGIFRRNFPTAEEHGPEPRQAWAAVQLRSLQPCDLGQPTQAGCAGPQFPPL